LQMNNNSSSVKSPNAAPGGIS